MQLQAEGASLSLEQRLNWVELEKVHELFCLFQALCSLALPWTPASPFCSFCWSWSSPDDERLPQFASLLS